MVRAGVKPRELSVAGKERVSNVTRGKLMSCSERKATRKKACGGDQKRGEINLSP